MDEKRTGKYGPPPNRAQVLEREKIAWDMRCHGATFQEIADRLGISQPGAYKICCRVEEREARRLSKNVHRVKARQNGQLEVIIHEGFTSWEESKKPRRRALSTTSGEGMERDEVTRHEAIDQYGDVRYLHMVLAAQADQRELTGLNIAAAENPGPRTVSELAYDLSQKEWEARQALLEAADNPQNPPPAEGP